MTGTTATAPAASPVNPAARPAKTEARQTKALPAPNSDFYQLSDVLTAEEKTIVNGPKVRGPAGRLQGTDIGTIKAGWSALAYRNGPDAH
jgi:hypothetical protein